MNIKQRIVLASLALLIFQGTYARGEDRTWLGASNQWKSDKPNNWSGSVVPGSNDTAVFASPVTANQPTLKDDTTLLGVAFTGTGGWTIGTDGKTLTTGTGGIDQTGSGLNTVATAVALSGSSTWTVSSGTLVISGAVSGAGTSGLTKDGAGILSMSGANTYTGVTKIRAGTLSASTLANGAANSSIGASGTAASNLVFDGGTLRYTGAATLTNRLFTLTENGGTIEANGTGAVTFGNAAAIAFSGNGARTLTLTGISTGTNTMTSIVGDGSGGATSLVKSGTGTWRLAGANTYSGGTTLNSGTLQLITAANRLSTSGAITVNGGTFDLGTFNQSTSGNVTIAGGVVTNGTLTKTFGNFAAQSGTASATLTGAAGLVKTTAGTFVMSGSSSYSGGTTVEEGTLQFSAANRLSTTGDIAVNGGTLNLGGFGQSTSGDVTIAGGIVSNGTLTKEGGNFSAQSGSVASNGILAGAVGFIKTTASSFILNGNHSYTGATSVNDGTLIVNGSIASIGVSVASGATLGGHGTVSAISGAGTVSPGESPGILTAASVNGSGGLDFHFEFTNAAVLGISAPDFLDAEDSGNDLLRITDATPFAFALDSDNTVTVDFSLLTLSEGDIYLGGFYTLTNSFASISGADFNYIGLGGYGVTASMVQWTANFGGGPVPGYITQFEITAIPEPHTFAFFTLSTVGMFALLRRRGRLNFN